MGFLKTFGYVLRHAWLWPFFFWQQPFAMLARIKEPDRQLPELLSALLGGAFWGFLCGLSIWYFTGNILALWVTPFAFAFAVAFAVAVAFDVAFAFAVAVAVAVAVAFDVAGAVAFAFAFAGAFAFAFAFAVAFVFAGTVAFAGTFAGAVFLFVGAGGISLGIWLPQHIQDILMLIVAGMTAFFSFCLLFGELWKKKAAPDWMFTAWGICWLIALPLGGFMFFPRLSESDGTIWGVVLFFSLTVGGLAGFIDRYSEDKSNDLRKYGQRQLSYLSFFWTVGMVITLAAWLPSPTTPGLDGKLEILAIFFILLAPLGTGLPLYPMLALSAWWQGRQSLGRNEVVKLVVLRWQTFAYPLPGMYNVLLGLSRSGGMKKTLILLREIQLKSLQDQTAARGARQLADNPETALALCGEVSSTSNSTTLASTGLAGKAARSVAALAREDKEEAKQPLKLYFGKFPKPSTVSQHNWEIESGFGIGPFGRSAFGGKDTANQRNKHWSLEFGEIRKKDLRQRLAYSLDNLEQCQEYHQANEFVVLLSVLHDYVAASSVAALSGLRVDLAEHRELMASLIDGAWLAQGYSLARSMGKFLKELALYREFSDVRSRREFLQGKIDQLSKVKFKRLSWYWAGIGQEIIEHWISLLTAEAEQAREWLSLDVIMPEQFLQVGHAELLLDVCNTSGVTARDITLAVRAKDGLHCGVTTIKQRLLEGNREMRLNLPLHTTKPGEYLLRGELLARDLADNSLTAPFSFRLNVGLKGKPYELPDYMPYVVGEGLGDDRTYTGRRELLGDLRGLWKQPGGNPAVLLVGQRRIGKTTLLNKIIRDDLADCGLLPMVVSIQDCYGEYDFLSEVARKAAHHLGISPPVLDQREPRTAFKSFILGLGEPLAGRRFLLMLDEADLIPTQNLETLPGFLRGMMQGVDYPTLLLFCGTYKLKRLGREYDSILFNTVHEFTVTYMSEAESEELLTKHICTALSATAKATRVSYNLNRPV